MEKEIIMLEVWMRIGQPLEPVMADYENIFNAWEEGGVRALVLGRMYLKVQDSPPSFSFEDAVPTFNPDPRVYRDLGVDPPKPSLHFPEKSKRLRAMLEDAKARGWPILVFEASAGRNPSDTGHILDGGMGQRAYLARMQDTLEHYPQVDGAIMDGPKFGYEIHPYHRSNILKDLPEALRGTAEELGYDYERVIAARNRRCEKLHGLSSVSIRLNSSAGMLS